MTPFRISLWLRPFVLSLLVAAVTSPVAAQPPAGQASMAWHVTIAPSWFDPSTAPPQITPFGILYALHDGLVRPYPPHKMGPSLAESWKESPDGKTYERSEEHTSEPQSPCNLVCRHLH